MNSQPPEEHDADLAKRLAGFTSVVVIFLLALFAYVYSGGPPFPLETTPGTHWSWRAAVIIMTLSGGALGGCLYNFRGITKHMENRDFYRHYGLSYYLRPLSAALCGIFVFALVYGGVLTLTLGKSAAVLDHRSIILYIAIALLAGYGSHEFLRKIKDLNRTLFALSEAERWDDIQENRPKKDDDGSA